MRGPLARKLPPINTSRHILIEDVQMALQAVPGETLSFPELEEQLPGRGELLRVIGSMIRKNMIEYVSPWNRVEDIVIRLRPE